MPFDRPFPDRRPFAFEPVRHGSNYDYQARDVDWDRMLQHGNHERHHQFPWPGQTMTLPLGLRNPAPNPNWPAQPTSRSPQNPGPFNRPTIYPARTTLRSPPLYPYHPAREYHTFTNRVNDIEPANSPHGHSDRDMELINSEQRIRRLSLFDLDEEVIDRQLRSFLALSDVDEELIKRRLRMLLLLLFALDEENSDIPPHLQLPSESVPRDHTFTGPANNSGYHLQPTTDHFLRSNNNLTQGRPYHRPAYFPAGRDQFPPQLAGPSTGHQPHSHTPAAGLSLRRTQLGVAAARAWDVNGAE